MKFYQWHLPKGVRALASSASPELGRGAGDLGGLAPRAIRFLGPAVVDEQQGSSPKRRSVDDWR